MAGVATIPCVCGHDRASHFTIDKRPCLVEDCGCVTYLQVLHTREGEFDAADPT